MITMQKGNKQIKVHDDIAEKYLEEGYCQIDESGKITKEATGGKYIPVQEANKLKDRIAELEKENEKLKKAFSKQNKPKKEDENKDNNDEKPEKTI